MISLHFCANPVVDFGSASAGNNDTFKKFFHHMLEHGVYLPPSPFESWFVSSSLSEEDIDFSISCANGFG
jgi:glutamate-1-semialdehyde 2,1-aminomutase